MIENELEQNNVSSITNNTNSRQIPQINIINDQMIQENIQNQTQNTKSENCSEFKKQLKDKTEKLFDQLLVSKPKGQKFLYKALKLGESYEEEIVQYNNQQLYSEHFISNFEKILELLHETKALCLRVPDQQETEDNKNNQAFTEHVTSQKQEVQRQIKKGAKDLTICKN